MGKFGYVDGLCVKVRTAWKRQIVQQVGAVSEQCALVFGGKALVDWAMVVASFSVSFLMIFMSVRFSPDQFCHIRHAKDACFGMSTNKADVNDARVVVNFYYQTIVIAFNFEDHPVAWQDVSTGVDHVKEYLHTT